MRIDTNDTIVSFTKQFILKISNIDYEQLIEKKEIVQFLSLSFDLSQKMAEEIIYLLTGKPNFSNIPADVCTVLLYKLISNCKYRRKFLLIIDDIHNANIELHCFLINLFDKVNFPVIQ
jgi:hypothetical protein